MHAVTATFNTYIKSCLSPRSAAVMKHPSIVQRNQEFDSQFWKMGNQECGILCKLCADLIYVRKKKKRYVHEREAPQEADSIYNNLFL